MTDDEREYLLAMSISIAIRRYVIGDPIEIARHVVARLLTDLEALGLVLVVERPEDS